MLILTYLNHWVTFIGRSTVYLLNWLEKYLGVSPLQMSLMVNYPNISVATLKKDTWFLKNANSKEYNKNVLFNN